jgi:hypothetical protein
MKRLILVFAVMAAMWMGCADNITNITQVTERIVSDNTMLRVKVEVVYDSVQHIGITTNIRIWQYDGSLFLDDTILTNRGNISAHMYVMKGDSIRIYIQFPRVDTTIKVMDNLDLKWYAPTVIFSKKEMS